ncbi:AzlD domain-containing protein [Viridibacillus sp. FSL E2-0187]|uniref:AzlD domain-containing protein n=1 Tax=Viridibacillus TaxID=496496 RepID=UPI00187B5EF2|nr:AzlD domain-containing protein [Viridibacillus sp. JNUCC-6]QOV10545.1 AzlD domain-containing protein [Viridibacillus sp. JNUCC-6]
MGSWYWWMLIGMALVTYIPRAIPLTFLEGKELPPIISGVLQNIPYAILGAMIFPAILLIKEGDILFGLVGTVTAFAIAFAGANVIIVVIGAIAILSIYSLFF